jgi:NitT/TauT family transport system substrate-binding protein
MLRKSIGAAVIALLPTQAQAEDIVVSQWGVSMAVAEYAVALDQGLFKAAKAPVTGIVSSQGGGTAVRTLIVANNAMGFGVVSLSAAMAAIQKGEDLKIVNIGARSAADTVLVTTKDSPVKTLADLKGQSIAITSPRGWSDSFAALAVKHAGIEAQDVKRVALGSLNGALTGLSKGTVQASFLLEPIASMRQGEYRVIFEGSQLPPMVQSVGVATTELIRTRPEAIRAIIAARKMAVASIKADPARAAASMAKYFQRVPADVLEKVVRTLIAADYWSDGDFEIAAMDRMLDGMRFIGGFQGAVDWQQALDTSFVAKRQ